ncbi:hypothetical protein GGE07_005470 [Sinorhizobium terangae]|nr:hypothetical protein [Sinorhizobium terangae]
MVGKTPGQNFHLRIGVIGLAVDAVHDLWRRRMVTKSFAHWSDFANGCSRARDLDGGGEQIAITGACHIGEFGERLLDGSGLCQRLVSVMRLT